MAPPKVRDERLAWLAVRDELARYSRSRPMTFVMRIMGNMAPTRRGFGTDATEVVTTGRMHRWSFAVHDVAQRLDAEERRVLRTTGRVPDWFLDAVRKRYRELRRRRA
jgi:hypothetical protein